MGPVCWRFLGKLWISFLEFFFLLFFFHRIRFFMIYLEKYLFEVKFSSKILINLSKNMGRTTISWELYNIYYQTGRVSSITFPATFLQDGSGEIGELWIAGSQVGLGYLRCQRKTTATSTRRFPPKIWGKTFRLGMAKEMRRIRRINIFFWGEDSIFWAKNPCRFPIVWWLFWTSFLCLFACHPGFLIGHDEKLDDVIFQYFSDLFREVDSLPSNFPI